MYEYTVGVVRLKAGHESKPEPRADMVGTMVAAKVMAAEWNREERENAATEQREVSRRYVVLFRDAPEWLQAGE